MTPRAARQKRIFGSSAANDPTPDTGDEAISVYHK
jgi:hypothetical protein